MKKIYFPSLNGIRFIAAFMVIVAHVSPYATERGFTASFFTIDYGALGVTVFFVLSGFLITYLLFHEKQETQTIHVKQFIIRRILRIWPAYFLAVGVGFFLFAPFHEGTRIFLEQHFWLKFSFFVLFLANGVRSVIFDAGVMSHLWSVCVEEQFYLAWPFLMKQFSHRFLTMAGSIIGGILLLRIVFAYWNIYHLAE